MKTVRARYTQRGPNPHELISPVEMDLPDLAPGEVRVEVLAAPINPSDVLTLTGEYGLLPQLPAVGGNEGVGRVIEAAADVNAPPVGTVVLLPVGCGSWSTHLQLPAKSLVPLPAGVDPVQLSMLTVNPPTALLMLRDFVELKPGDWVIQNAANSAVGGYLVQIAKLRGINTLNVVRRESAVDAVREAGGEHVLIDGDDLPKQARAITGDAPVKLGIDCVGGVSTENLARCLSEGATLLNYGAMSGERCMISPRYFVFRDITLRGFWLSQWFKNADPEARKAVFAEVGGLIATGKLKARVQQTYPIADIAKAVAAAAAGERGGKIVLVPNG
ncbi:zinc-dependent alcohol dehydrogenase family protein [Pseudomarimonas salicorniae]|uniref:enoyl-[acyl-carrier-protein] reductase n=1 Tax=Pseudomarimonas salicorniae TaxID=2933270 RepID=A0ABT0GH69_9GAMM|nr:zinc-dependent alcohol dehydrogenase family protein [Lysobacter sp. CAU 1642]MCK7593773.1 zinc-dependent alcohol dehydrogenase family protein [Lysobacter sp. CAU 1642]